MQLSDVYGATPIYAPSPSDRSGGEGLVWKAIKPLSPLLIGKRRHSGDSPRVKDSKLEMGMLLPITLLDRVPYYEYVEVLKAQGGIPATLDVAYLKAARETRKPRK